MYGYGIELKPWQTGMSVSRKTIGDRGEHLAARFLRNKGYVVVERNFRYQRAEIDIICERKVDGFTELVFVEVKTRFSRRFGRPEEAIGRRKWDQIWRAAEGYVLLHRVWNARMRFDVITIEYERGMALINHIQDAF